MLFLKIQLEYKIVYNKIILHFQVDFQILTRYELHKKSIVYKLYIYIKNTSVRLRLLDTQRSGSKEKTEAWQGGSTEIQKSRK